MSADNLATTARALVAAGKGILAADESQSTIEKRFQAAGIACTEESRRDYRELLFTAPGLEAFISGVILFDETFRQKDAQGVLLVERLKRANIIPGIKVDRGAKALAGFPGEKVTEGLDGLRDRLAEYARLGARFTKWRAVIAVGPEIPSAACLHANAQALARFAALSQEAGLVPLVEPEVLMDGAHAIERHFEVTTTTLHCVFRALAEHRVNLEGMLLKTNMVLPGTSGPAAGVDAVAAATRRCLRLTVPVAVPGVVFLSGGQEDVLATRHLNALNRMDPVPWELSFSYGRALQAPAMQAWRGKPSQAAAAQAALLHRARCNSAARFGQYTEAMEVTERVQAV